MSVHDLAFELARLLMSDVGAPKWPQRPPKLDFAVDDQITGQLEATINQDARFAELDVAIIDFSGSSPRVGMSSRPDNSSFIASMAKLGIIYAAFQLREDVRNVVRENIKQSSDGNGTFQQLTDADRLNKLKLDLQTFWKSNSNHLMRDEIDAATGKKTGKAVAERADIGRLEYIFTLNTLQDSPPDPNKIDFIGIEQCGLDKLDVIPSAAVQEVISRLDSFPHGKNSPENWRNVAELDFAARLWMGLAWSDNVAASTCVWDIGLPYIQALLLDSSLFDGSNGLYLVRNYIPSPPAGTRFGNTPTYFPPNTVGPVQRGTVRALTALMIAIERGELISDAASADMQRLLRPVRFATSGLANAGDTRVPNALGRGPADPVERHPTDALIKGGVNREEVKNRQTNRVTALSIACDWEYLKFGNQPRLQSMGIIILFSKIAHGIPDQLIADRSNTSDAPAAKAKANAARVKISRMLRQAEDDAESLLRDFAVAAGQTFNSLIGP